MAGASVDEAWLWEAALWEWVPESSCDPREEQEPGAGFTVNAGGHRDCNEQEDEGSGQQAWPAG